MSKIEKEFEPLIEFLGNADIKVLEAKFGNEKKNDDFDVSITIQHDEINYGEPFTLSGHSDWTAGKHLAVQLVVDYLYRRSQVGDIEFGIYDDETLEMSRVFQPHFGGTSVFYNDFFEPDVDKFTKIRVVSTNPYDLIGNRQMQEACEGMSENDREVFSEVLAMELTSGGNIRAFQARVERFIEQENLQGKIGIFFSEDFCTHYVLPKLQGWSFGGFYGIEKVSEAELQKAADKVQEYAKEYAMDSFNQAIFCVTEKKPQEKTEQKGRIQK